MIRSSAQPDEIAAALQLLSSGDPGAAESILTDYCRQCPENPDGWYLLGAAKHAQSKTAAALASMEHSLDIDPTQTEVLKATAMLLLELGRYRAAHGRAERACALLPGDAQAWLTVGVILEAMGKRNEGLSCYERALELRPGWQPALINRGAVLLSLGHRRQALENYRSLVKAFPEQADSHFNLAEALLACGDYTEAECAAKRSLALNDRHVGARIDLALSKCMQGQYDAARLEFATSFSIDKDQSEVQFRRAAAAAGTREGMRAYQHPEDLCLWQLGETQKSCDWRHRPQLMRSMADRIDRLVGGKDAILPFPAVYFHALSLPLGNAQQLVLARATAAGATERAPMDTSNSRPTRYRRFGSPLRIGYISPDYCLHPVAYLHWRQMALHDRDRFQVYAYSLSPDDNSEIREKVRSSCDEWRSCENDTIQLTAARIRYDGIHLLVDLSGYTRDTRPEILALRPAPIQVAYMGMPATSGASFIDYRITDRITTPAEQAADWPERLVRFPSTLFIYNDQQVIAAPPSREDFGLPQNAFVFCCFNNTFKIEPDVFRIWMRLLQRHPQSVLWLLSDNELAKDNLRREAHARGVDPERLVFATFLPFSEHLARYALADLFLDTFYCGAHTTAADALWGGLPVLTCLGETMAARQAASIVNAAGLPDMIVSSHEEYEALALHLAGHPVELAGIKRRLLDSRRHAPLFNTASRVRELEYSFETMWQRHLAGLPPESFAVPEDAGTGT